MRAVVYTAYGDQHVTQIVEAAKPEPATGEVQVRVTAVGLNPIDWHQRNGDFKFVYPQQFPVTAGNEFSGIVTKIGSGVTHFSINDRVICRCAKAKWGALGEFVVMPAAICADAPTTIPLADAAGLPLAGLTALQCLEALQVQGGDRVLITGGAGGVGQFAIQLAKLRGAHVSATASPAGFESVRSAGADEVINYRSDKTSDSEPFDKVFDTVGGDALASDVVLATKAGGTIISVGGPPTPGCMDSTVSWWMRLPINAYLRYLSWSVVAAATKRRVVYRYMFMTPDGRQLKQLSGLVSRGELKISIDSRYPLERFSEAFERLESGRAKGKVIVEFDDSKRVKPLE